MLTLPDMVLVVFAGKRHDRSIIQHSLIVHIDAPARTHEVHTRLHPDLANAIDEHRVRGKTGRGLLGTATGEADDSEQEIGDRG